MVINFKKFPIFTSIKKDMVQEVDIKENLANTLYMSGLGIGVHALALKIYNDDSETTLSDKEIELLNSLSNLFTPVFMESFNDYVQRNKIVNNG